MLSAAGCSRTVPVQNPQPIQAAPDYRVTEQAIRQALANRGWTIQDQRPGAITAQLAQRSHLLLAQINYDQRAVFVSFVGSQNLKQQDRAGVIYVHRKANQWLENLQRDISVNLTRGPMAPQPGYGPGPAPAPGPAAPPPGY